MVLRHYFAGFLNDAFFPVARSMHCLCARQRKAFFMKITLEIGETEKHRFEYNFNQLIGRLVVKVNEVPIQRSVRLINEPTVEIHVFTVGNHEQYNIRVERERKQLIGHRGRVFVNNRLVKVMGNN